MLVVLLLVQLLLGCASASEPTLDTSTVNVVAAKGQRVILPCSITSLGRHKVGWIGANGIVLTIEDRRVVDDVRFSVTRRTVDDWALVIADAQIDDSGSYKCTLNTDPVRSKTVMLTVQASPRITVHSEGDGRTVVPEGGFVNLTCNASGVPAPRIFWTKIYTPANPLDDAKEAECRYETSDGFFRVINPYLLSRNEDLGSGKSLRIAHTSRHCGGEYKCLATNNLPPDEEKVYFVDVVFAPNVSVLSSRLSQNMGKETMLQCNVHARPYGVVYWERGGVKITNSVKYQIDAFEDVGGYFVLTLKFKISHQSDYGEYVCEAANLYGMHQSSVELIEYIPRSSSENPTPSSTEAGHHAGSLRGGSSEDSHYHIQLKERNYDNDYYQIRSSSSVVLAGVPRSLWFCIVVLLKFN